MRKRISRLGIAALLLVAVAAEPPSAAASGEVYGRQLMTLQEEDAYRRKVWELKTEAERERFRREHHRRMRERARDLGVHLPDDPAVLDRPYFEKAPAEGLNRSPSPERRPWSASRKSDSLRRWPPKDDSAEPVAGRPYAADLETEEKPEKRRWPPERTPPFRSGEKEKPAVPRLPPGAGEGGGFSR